MISRIIVLLLMAVPMIADAAPRGDSVRVGVARPTNTAARVPTVSKTLTVTSMGGAVSGGNTGGTVPDAPTDDTDTETEGGGGQDCRAAYRACMDEFCLLDESEGYRCACSSNIEKSKDLILEIQKIQEEADNLYAEGVEREKLGAQAKLVFGESDAAKKSSLVSGIDFLSWVNSAVDTDGEDGLGADYTIGDGLYEMASEFCAVELGACGARADMEQALYERQITADCKAYNAYLADQKTNVLANKRTAEAAVRVARLDMLSTTNKYNRGECLLAYRACIADKGGCGTNFENCLDADLLGRRAYACENVLDQCMAVKNDVLADWEMESQSILANAEKYADKYKRQTCLAQIQVCLEDGCSTSTDSACLTNISVAAGICPIIDECDDLVPGLKDVVSDKLGYLRTQFCQNDVDACLRDKCGANFTEPECIGKKVSDIVAMCPQDMFPSCKTETQFDIIVSAAMLQMDYQMMQGCINYFGEQLGRVCGTDMSCLPANDTVMALQQVPATETEFAALRVKVRDDSKIAVDEFFEQFEGDKTVAQCLDAEKPAGSKNLGGSVFTTAKLIAEIGAENRVMRELETKIAELSRQQDIKEAEQNCYNTFKVEEPDKSAKNYSYIRSVAFEPALRNCHVCRMQQICEEGGESKASAALKAAAGGLTGGASMGTMVNAGWGTAIGGVIGAVGAGIGGFMSGGKQEFCQEIESCEDINM